jgi:hypothetical protein
MWGGNYGDGITNLLEYYKPAVNLNEKSKELWCLKGVDCSGLLYQSTNGMTPRNTSSLVSYGEGLSIEGKSSSEISKIVKPLDLIVWSGHVVIVIDEITTIESTPDSGVHKSNLNTRLKQILSERKAVNDWNTTTGKRFVIRHWID